MVSRAAGPERDPAPPAVYEQLQTATPTEKVDIVLRLIEEHPEGRLDLSERDGVRADLRGIDLSPHALRPRVAGQTPCPIWWDSDDGRAFLLGARLEGADLRGANLEAADLRDAHLEGADLRDARLAEADLVGSELAEAALQGADLQGACLQHARLAGLDLRRAALDHIYVSGAWLDRTRLHRDQLGGEIGEERDAEDRQRSPEDRLDSYRDAEDGYHLLRQNFESLADSDGASWAYRKTRQMRKRARLQAARAAQDRRSRESAVHHLAGFAVDQLTESLCDYGESIWKVLRSLVLVLLIFTVLNALLVTHADGRAVDLGHGREWLRVFLYSLGSMTTMGPGSLPNDLHVRFFWLQWLPGLEALVAVANTGLLGFVVGNRIRRS